MSKKIALLTLFTSFAALAVFATDYPPGREIPLPLPKDTSAAVRHFAPSIACDADQCLVVWTAFNDGNRLGWEVRGARIDKSGHLLDATSFTIGTPSYQNTSSPQVIALESDYVVFYSAMLYARVSRTGIVTARDLQISISTPLGTVCKFVTSGGSILMYSQENHGPIISYITLLDPKLNVVSEVKIDGQPSDIASAPNGFVVASVSVDGLKVTRLSADGSVVSTSAVPVFSTGGNVAAAGDTVLVAWRRQPTTDAPATIEFATISRDGTQHRGVLDKSISASLSVDIASIGSEYLVAFSRPSAGYYTNQVYVRRVSSGGELLDSGAVPVTGNFLFQIGVKCAAVDGGYLTVWSDLRYGSGHDHVVAATISAKGDIGPDFLVSHLAVSQQHAVLATTGTVVATAWREAAGSAPGLILFMRAHPDGTLLDPAPISLSSTGGNPAIASHGDSFIVAWREFNFARVAIIDANGRVTTGGGISVPGTGDVSIATGPADIIVTCENANTILIGHVRYDGTVIDYTPRPIASGTDPHIGFDGQHYWLVDRATGNIEARRLATDGTLFDTVPFTLAGAADGTHDQLAVACGQRNCAVLWRTIGDDQNTIEGAVLTTGGAVSGIVAARDAEAAQPALTWNGDAYFVMWSTQDGGASTFGIHAEQLSASGNLIGNDQRITETDVRESAPAVSTAGSVRVLAFSRAADADVDRVYLRFDHDAPRNRSVRH